MKKRSKCLLVTILIATICIVVPSVPGTRSKQIPKTDLIRIMQAEDELRFDTTLKEYLKGNDSKLKIRAALAAGRIVDETALPLLTELLTDKSDGVAAMAMFAIGEISSVKGTPAVLSVLRDTAIPDAVRARAVEAAGKIAGSIEDTDEAKANLGKTVLNNLEFEIRRGEKQSREVVLLGITAVIRSKPDGADNILSKFLVNPDARIRADAANAAARIGSKNLNWPLRSMLVNDNEPLARANAARALGGAKDESSISMLLAAAFSDDDQRVRTNALNAIGAIAEKATGLRLLQRAESLLVEFKRKSTKADINELLTIAAAVGRTLEGSDDKRAVGFLNELREEVGYRAPEAEIAIVRVSPRSYKKEMLGSGYVWQQQAAYASALGTASELKGSAAAEELRKEGEKVLRRYLTLVKNGKESTNLAYPAVLTAYARFKTDDLPSFLKESLSYDDVVVRGTAARLLGELELQMPPDKALDNYFALRDAFDRSEPDTLNDAALAALDGIGKQYQKLKDIKGVQIDLLDPVKRAFRSPDYLVRRRAREIAKEIGMSVPVEPERVSFFEKGVTRVKRANYERALARKSAAAVLTTSRGTFTIELYPEAAPLTVENFVELARSGYFDGLAIHRVVPNFVVQDGDPRGDGSGGPGWQIRCEINQIPYERGTVGMALSGKDTGGSQWFVAHSPQPHLDGGYTVFGKVNEENMLVVDRLARGDIIKKIEIVEEILEI